MKRKFIFLAMLLLTLIGGVKWNVLNAQEGVYRIKSNSTGKYMHVFNTYSHQTGQTGGVGAYDKDENNLKQVFRFIAGDNGGYYLQCVSNNCYIKCWEWNVDALSSSSTELFGFNFDGESFSISNVNVFKGSVSTYFKTESVSGNYYIFCDVTEGASNVDTYTLEQIPAPAAPTNLVVTNVTYNSVSLSWTDENNATKYRIYKDGAFVGETTEKTYTVTDLEGETTYNFTVKSVSFYTNESEDSNTATETTPVAPKTRDVVFTLMDTYGDGWNGGTLSVIATDGTNRTLTFTNGTEQNYQLSIAIDAAVTVVFNAGSYAYEASYRINYDGNDGDVIVVSETNGKVNGSTTFYFTVESNEPSVVASKNSITLGSVRMGNYWSENTVSETFNITAKYTTITEVSCSNAFFDVDYDETTGVVTVGYNKNAEVTDEQTGIITIKATDVEDVTVDVSATPYTPVTPDVIELATNVTFEEGVYTDIPEFTTLHDDYNLPKEVNAGSTPDAVYHFTMKNEGILTVNVTGTNAIAAVYKAEDMEGSGPMANNNDKGGAAGPAANTTFLFDFQDQSLDAFNLIDANNDGKNWVIGNKYNSDIYYVMSYSWQNSSSITPDNYIVTKEAYAITAASKLTYKVNAVNGSTDYYAVVVSTDGTNFDPIFEEGYNSSTQVDREVDLSKYAGQELYIGFRHYNCTGQYYIVIDDFKLTDGSAKSRSLARSTEPQINGVQYPAGEYYLVAAAEDAFTVSIETGSLPAPSEFAYIAPADGAKEQNNPILTWEAAQYATEYKVYLGTSDWMTEENLVATVTTPSYQTEGLSNNTKYVWKVDAVNETGTQNGTAYSFVTPLDVPQNVAATPSNLYPGQATVITWDAVTNASSYNVYNGDKLLATLEPTVTSYELSGLAYNINGHNISITATQEGLGESLKSSVVVIKVAGEFQLVVSVKDSNGNPIDGATVSIDMTYAYDQFGQQVNAVNPETTVDGNATFTLPLLNNSTRYIVTAAKAPYEDATNNIYDYKISNNSTYTCYSTLNLPKVNNLAVENGDYVLQEDSELVLTWDVIEGATEYKVYKKENLVETVTTNKFTTTAVYDNAGSKYAVSAVFEGGLESDKTYTDYIYVLGNGTFSGFVKEGTKYIEGLTVKLSGTNAIGEDVVILTTDENGYFEGEILEGNDYTLTISHYDYEEVVIPGIVIDYSTPNDLGTIVLTAKPKATISDVTATVKGEYANVTWTGDYAKYNVYRQAENEEPELLGEGDAETKAYTDIEWAGLDYGNYRYGVSAFVEEQAQSRGETKVLYSEGIENGNFNGWTNIGQGWYYWKVDVTSPKTGSYAMYLNYGNGTATMTLTTPEIELEQANNLVLSFYYKNYPYGSGYNGVHTINVKVKSIEESSWTTIGTINDTQKNYTLFERQLDDKYSGKKIQISFEGITSAYASAYIDDITITGEVSSAKESQIVWSNELVKQVPNTFEGTESTDWNTEANWSRNEVPSQTDDVIIATNAVIRTDVNIKSITINEGATLTLASGVLNVTDGIYNENVNAFIIEDGAQLFQNNDNLAATFNMDIINPDNWTNDNQKGWQFISSPFVDATVASFIPSEGEYDLYKYDGTQKLEWVNHKGENSGGSGESGDTFYYDFNDASVDDWTKIDEDGDDQNWGVTSSGIYAGYEESVGLYSSCYANDKELYPDNYFVTNKAYAITSTSFLSFLHHTSDALYTEENFGVVVSENGTDWIVIWSKKYDYDAPDEDWQEANVSLADYAGKNVYLGFRHYNCNGSSANGIRIDNVRLSSEVGNSASGTSSFEETFTQGVGYLASYEIAATVALNGELNPNTSKTWGQYYYAEKDLANFRLLGNPFTFDMDMSKLSSYGMATGYAVVNANGEYEYKTDGIVNVGDGFFVKVAADYATLTYDHSYVAPVSRGSEKANSINVIASGKAGKDNVIVNFAGQDEGFNKLQNFNEDIATVFVANNGKRYGIANVDENATEVELSFVASQMGNYSISLDVNGEFETVTLVDRFTGIETNMLLEDEYNFTATSNDSHNRFVIRLANGQEPTANSQFVYQSGEELILSIEGSVQIVDMLGRVVYYNEHANGDNRINVAEFNDAAYVVRVVNEEGVKTQKVVIY